MNITSTLHLTFDSALISTFESNFAIQKATEFPKNTHLWHLGKIMEKGVQEVDITIATLANVQANNNKLYNQAIFVEQSCIYFFVLLLFIILDVFAYLD